MAPEIVTIPAIRKSKHHSYASADDWDAHYHTIARLYLYEEMRLREVKIYMEENHAFFATEKMYKMRISKWGLGKNHNPDRVAYMLRRKRDRAAAGKPTAFSIHNRPVDWADVERYLRRRPDILAKIDAGTDTLELGSATAGIVCRSPSPDPARMLSVPAPLAPERLTRLHDDILRLVHAYLDGAFSTSLWHYSPAARCYLGRAGYAGQFRAASWACDIWSAVHRSGHGSPAAAVAAINAQMDRLAVLIAEQDCSLFLQMLRAHHYLHAWNRDVGAAVAAFAADMCEVRLGTRHPFALAWRRVQELDDGAGLQATLADVARLRLDYLAARPDGRSAPSLLEDHFMALGMRRESSAAEMDGLASWILEYADRRGEPVTSDYCRLMLRLAVPQTFHGSYEGALRLLRRVAAWLDEGHTDDVYFVMVASRYHLNMSLLLDDIGDWEGSREQMGLGRNLCTLYDEPSEELVEPTQEFALGYGVAGNPEKAARWLGFIDESFRDVLTMANTKKSPTTRNGRGLSTSGPGVSRFGEEDWLLQAGGQDGIGKEPEPVGTFMEQFDRLASRLPGMCPANT